MIGRSGSMIGSGSAFASQASRSGKIRPNAVLVCVPLMVVSPGRVIFPITAPDYRMRGAWAQARMGMGQEGNGTEAQSRAGRIGQMGAATVAFAPRREAGEKHRGNGRKCGLGSFSSPWRLPG